MPDLYQDCTITLRGLRFHYLDWGSEGKPPFVCLHGGAQTAHSWDDFAPVMRSFVTPMGSGRSSSNERACSTQSCTSALPSSDNSAIARTASRDSSIRRILSAVVMGRL